MTETDELANRLLNCAPGFWEAYRQRPGMPRRRALLQIFNQHPVALLPVNNKWQAASTDPDLQNLLKRGVLKRLRDAGGRRHSMNKSSRKRQTYLALVRPAEEGVACGA